MASRKEVGERASSRGRLKKTIRIAIKDDACEKEGYIESLINFRRGIDFRQAGQGGGREASSRRPLKKTIRIAVKDDL